MKDPRNPLTAEFVASPFFHLRTPVLPFDEFARWNQGLLAPDFLQGHESDAEPLRAAIEHDEAKLRERLRAFFARDEEVETLFVASPPMLNGLEEWRKDEASKKGACAEPSLTRYFLRMLYRCTPFGLMAGCSLGSIEGSNTTSSFQLGARREYRRKSRLDMRYLCALAQALAEDPELIQALRFVPNTSLYLKGGKYRYAESRLEGSLLRHHLVAVDAETYLGKTLDLSAGGATLAELGAGLVGDDPEIELDDALEYLRELVSSQILVSELVPNITGEESLHGLVRTLERYPEGAYAAGILKKIEAQLRHLDEACFGSKPERYRAIAADLEKLPAKIALPRLFQVDMIKKPADLRLSAGTVKNLLRGVEALHRLSGPRDPKGSSALTTFRQLFLERYQEGHRVRLVDALDEESGIGFRQGLQDGIDAATLLRGLSLGSRKAAQEIPLNAKYQMLLDKWLKVSATGGREIVLDDQDLEVFAQEDLPELPDTFCVMGSLGASSPEALARDELDIVFTGASGPSGARMMGRFCHADPQLRHAVEGHLRSEEAHQPEVVFAELVHLTEGRPGNILQRPLLRTYEIPYLARSGAAPEHQLPITDLWLTVENDQIFLYSERLGRRVLPRLTTAHVVNESSLGLYSFLWTLQIQGIHGGFGWNWGPLDTLDFLPRVRIDRCVLARARWRLPGDELRELLSLTGAARFAALKKWLVLHHLPRQVTFVDGDKKLLVDFGNVLVTDAFLTLVRRYQEVLLEELFPAPHEHVASGPEGHFASEIIVPFERRRTRKAAPAPVGTLPPPATPVPRSFPPGSKWLFVKVYCGAAIADRILRDAVAGLLEPARSSGLMEDFFFIRYGDPRWHLRLRFRGEEKRLLQDLLPQLQTRLEPLRQDGHVWKIQLDTYEREVERYGGGEGVIAAEELACADSEAVLSLLALLKGDSGTDERWQLALLGMFFLLKDFGLETPDQARLMGRIRDAYFREFGGDKILLRQLDTKLRSQRPLLLQLLATEDPAHPMPAALTIFRQRSERNAPIYRRLRELEAHSALRRPLEEILPSYLHMFANRILRGSGRSQELVLGHFLHKLLTSLVARRVSLLSGASK